MSMEVKVTSHMDDVMNELKDARQRALNAVGLQLERNAKIEINKAVYDTQESPNYVRTGRLRASITYATKTAHGEPGKEAEDGDADVREEPEENAVYVGTNVEYAPYVELGSSKMSPRPYLRPALENHIEEYRTIIQTELKS